MNPPEVRYKYWRDEAENLDCWGVEENYKKDLLRWYGKTYNLKIFVETGTYTGEAIAQLKDDFDTLYSIEINPDLYKKAVERFKDESKAHLYLGNSGRVLNQLLPQIPNVPTLFWIDAHVHNKAPIREELEAIFRHRNSGAILVDDLQGFWNNDWPDIVRELALIHNTWKFELTDGIARFIKES